MKNIFILLFLLINIIGYSQSSTSPTYKKVTSDSIVSRKDSLYLRGSVSSKHIIMMKKDSVTTNKAMRNYIKTIFTKPAINQTFSGVIDLSNYYYTSYLTYTISSALSITVNSTKINGSSAILVILSDGNSAHIPSFTGMYMATGSGPLIQFQEQ